MKTRNPLEFQPSEQFTRFSEALNAALDHAKGLSEDDVLGGVTVFCASVADTMRKEKSNPLAAFEMVRDFFSSIIEAGGLSQFGKKYSRIG